MFFIKKKVKRLQNISVKICIYILICILYKLYPFTLHEKIILLYIQNIKYISSNKIQNNFNI